MVVNAAAAVPTAFINLGADLANIFAFATMRPEDEEEATGATGATGASRAKDVRKANKVVVTVDEQQEKERVREMTRVRRKIHNMFIATDEGEHAAACIRPRIVVQKFGGTCIGTPEKLQNVCNIIKEQEKDCDLLIPVLSAASATTKNKGTTESILLALDAAASGDYYVGHLNNVAMMNSPDHIETERVIGELTRMCRQVFLQVDGATANQKDWAVSKGEVLAMWNVVRSLSEQGAFLLGMNMTTSLADGARFNEDVVIQKMQDVLVEELRHFDGCSKAPIHVTPGHIGRFEGGLVNAVGRGYTDYTAALLAVATGADELQIWKESAGVFTCNPTKFANEARMVSEIGFRELVELTAFGNDVVHPRAAALLAHRGIEVVVKDVRRPLDAGTRVRSVESPPPVRAVCSKDDVHVLKAVNSGRLSKTEFMRALFDTLDRHGVEVVLMSTSMSVASVVLGKDVGESDFLTDLRAQQIGVTVLADRSIVSCVGEGMNNLVGVAAEIVKQVHAAGANIEMLSQSNSELNVSVVVKSDCSDTVVRRLHTHFVKEPIA